jgi:hypothetical protein
MARMSIDDKLLRDPRAIRLGRAFGWRRQEAVGRLMDVFALTYDRESDVLPAADIDIAAEQDGFTDRMIEVDLAEHVRGGVRIKGAAERIAYLQGRHEAGRLGGLKSAETRRKKAQQKSKHTFDSDEARRNPPDPVPDPVPDDPPDLPDTDLSPARVPAAVSDPAVAVPASRPAPVPIQGDPALVQRQALRTELWRELAAARAAVGAELRVEHRPLAAHDPGERVLSLLIAGAPDLEGIAADVRHAIAIATAEARRDQSLQWLTGVIFDERNFRRLTAVTLEEARRPRPAKPGAPAARMPARRADPSPPVVTVSAEDRAAAAAELVDARARLFGQLEVVG